MKNRIIPLFAIMLCITILTVTPSKKNEIYAETEDKKVQIFARNGQNEGIVKVEREYTGLNIKWKSTTAYEGLHVRVIGSVIPDEGKDYVDLRQYTRLEYEVREGVTKEYFAPSYIDSDGTYVIVGTLDGNSSTAGTKINYKGDLTYPNNNGTYDGLKGTNYCGSPVWMTEGNEDFANYHVNIDNASVKTYTDWASGLTLTSNGEANKDKIKCFAINMIKQKNNREFDWDFCVLKVYGRDALGNKKLIFDASNAEMTDSISTVWNNKYALTQKSYVYVQNNLGSNYSDFEATINTSSKYTASETQPGDSFKIIKKNGGSMWGWSRLLEAEKGAIVDCSEYDAAIFELNNTTGHPLSLKPRYDYDNGSGVVNCDAGQLTLVGEDGTITETVDYVIPAGFKGTVYSFFSNALNNFSSNLEYVKNDFRMVVNIDDNNDGKTFELSNYRFTKTGLEQYKNQVINALEDKRAEYDDSKYTVSGVSNLNKIVEDTKLEIEECTTFNNIRGIYNTNISLFDDVDLKEIELRKNAIRELENYVSLNDYYELEKIEIQNIINSAKDKINSLLIEDEINQTVLQAKSSINEVQTKEQKDALLISQYKATAILEIENYSVDLSKYRENEKQIILNIKLDAVNRINQCTNLETINQMVSTIKIEIDNVKTDQELVIEELELEKNNAITYVNDYVSLENYYENERKTVVSIIDEILLDINNEDNIDNIETIKQFFKTKIDAVKTKQIIDLENLVIKKGEAKEIISAYKVDEEYYENEQKMVNSLKTEANQRIDICDSSKKVEILVDKIKEEIDQIPNKGQMDEINFANAKSKSLLELKEYLNKGNYYQEQINEINAILDSSSNVISPVTTQEELKEEIKKVISLLDLVKTKEQIDDERKKEELDGIVKKIEAFITSIDQSILSEEQRQKIDEFSTSYTSKIISSNNISDAKDLEKALYIKVNDIIKIKQNEQTEQPKNNIGLLTGFIASCSLVAIGGICLIIVLKKRVMFK